MTFFDYLTPRKQLFNIKIAIQAVNAEPNRPNRMELADKSIAFIKEGWYYRVIFAYRGKELAVERLDADGKNILHVKTYDSGGSK